MGTDGTSGMAYEERVTRVIDGNTFETDAGERRVAGLYVPDPGGFGARVAHTALEKLIDGKIVTIEPAFPDRDGVQVVAAQCDGRSVADSMVGALHAQMETIAARWEAIGFIEGQVQATGASILSRGIEYSDWYIGFVDERETELRAIEAVKRGHNVHERDPWMTFDTTDVGAMRDAVCHFIRAKGMRGRLPDDTSQPRCVYCYMIRPHTKQPGD